MFRSVTARVPSSFSVARAFANRSILSTSFPSSASASSSSLSFSSINTSSRSLSTKSPEDPFDLGSATQPITAPSTKAPAPNQGQREKGQVKWFDRQKGYGFIGRENGPDLFVHFTGLRGEARILEEGQSVSFVIGPGRKGKGEIATDVSISQ